MFKGPSFFPSIEFLRILGILSPVLRNNFTSRAFSQAQVGVGIPIKMHAYRPDLSISLSFVIFCLKKMSPLTFEF